MPRILSNEQAVAFDSSEWDQKQFERWMRVEEIDALLSSHLGDHSEVRFLDVGGATGRFADILLTRHQSWRAAVGDNSELLLSRNQPNARKAVKCVDAWHLEETFGPESFDVVFVHRLLHHLVGDDYPGSLRLIQNALQQCAAVLKPYGRLSVIENIWDGWLIDDLASRLLYYATSSRRAAPLARRLGANTAGTGVCYLSDRLLNRLLRRAGFEVEVRQIFAVYAFPWYIRYPTLLKRGQSLHYWCQRTQDGRLDTTR